MKHSLGSTTGHFNVSDEHKLLGELILSGRNTSLKLYNSTYFNAHNLKDRYICGVLATRERVSLHDCICPGAGSRFFKDDSSDNHYFANVFPHYVLIGKEHLSPSDPRISAVQIALIDAPDLFYDFHTFSSCFSDVSDLVREAVERSRKKYNWAEEIPVFANAELAYWTGKTNILECETAFGKLRFWNRTSPTPGGPRGVSFANSVQISLEFETGKTFSESQKHLFEVLTFLSLIIGRDQNPESHFLQLDNSSTAPSSALQVLSSMEPKTRDWDEESRPSPRDMLLWPVEETDEFVNVSKHWFDHDDSTASARAAIISGITSNFYSPDRLIKAANMFDHLSVDLESTNLGIPEDLQTAKNDARQLFKALPISYDRDMVLQALSRVGGPTLRQRVQQRMSIIRAKLPNAFPEIELVIDESIKCRNMYVHGPSGGEPDYEGNFHVVAFLTNVLEFIFCASSLIECGWNIERWMNSSTSQTHSFGTFRISYQNNLRNLKELTQFA